jgi:uncharacterized membrane protein HdeD (DUF308 family)
VESVGVDAGLLSAVLVPLAGDNRSVLRVLSLAATGLITAGIVVFAKPLAGYASKSIVGFVLVVVGAALVTAASLWVARQVDKSRR